MGPAAPHDLSRTEAPLADGEAMMRAIGLEYHDVITGEDFDASGFPGAAAASYKLTVPSFDAHMRAIAATRRWTRGAAPCRCFSPSMTAARARSTVRARASRVSVGRGTSS